MENISLINITLKTKLPESLVDACDISNNALDVAKDNAKLNNADINFIHSDLFSNVNKKYDVIICSTVLHRIEPEKWSDFLQQFNL